MKKGGGMFSWLGLTKEESKFDSVVPEQSSVQTTNVTSTPTPENKSSSSMFGDFTMTNPFSGVSAWLGSASQEKRNTEFEKGKEIAEKSDAVNNVTGVAAAVTSVGGKKRSRKSRKSKKRVLKK